MIPYEVLGEGSKYGCYSNTYGRYETVGEYAINTYRALGKFIIFKFSCITRAQNQVWSVKREPVHKLTRRPHVKCRKTLRADDMIKPIIKIDCKWCDKQLRKMLRIV